MKNKEEKLYELFCNDVKNYKVLSKAEQVKIFVEMKKFKEGSEEYLKLRDELILSNIGFITTVAKRYLVQSRLTILDLINEGIIGFIKSLKTFDETKSDNLLVHSYYYIKQEIDLKVDFYKDMIRTPYKSKINYKIYSLDNLCSIEDSDSFIDFNETSTEEYENQLDLKMFIESILDKCGVTDKQKDIIKLKFGLTDGIERNFVEISDKLRELGYTRGFTRESIRTLYNRAMIKIKYYISKHYSIEELKEYF